MNEDTAKLASMLLDTGVAVSKRQAFNMAAIIVEPGLSETARDSLLMIARRVGAEFEPAFVTQHQIEQAVADVLAARRKIAMSLLPTEGGTP